MADNYVSVRNIEFMLHEVFEAESLNRFERFQDYDKEGINMAITAAKSISDNYLFPIYREMDKKKAYVEDGVVHVHPGLKAAIKAMAEGGWIGAGQSYDDGGQQMPALLESGASMIFNSANGNAVGYAFLTNGAANLIQSFGSKEIKDTYIKHMYSGDWQGTMALTEPQAGSSLTDVTTSATPTDQEGAYKIKGQKIYISGGDHTAVDNVVHLTLARIDGAPAGTKGISLFVVPKHRPDGDGLTSNDVLTAGIYGKMGQKGYVAAHLMMGENDNTVGYLVGEEHRGLKYMFQMMNEARIGTGLMATGNASAAYYASLKYAKERPQGRHPDNKDPLADPVLIINHADVRRMLLFQKAVAEGGLSLLLECSKLHDIHIAGEGEEAANAHLLLELLTPIAKSYPAEMATHAVSAGMQVLGGAGYTDDFPLEQIYRDVRINSIYEGTTTIHGMDLLGRKVIMNKGAGMKLLMENIQGVMKEAMAHDSLKPYAEQLGMTGMKLHEITMSLITIAAEKGPRHFLSDATMYLDYFGTTVIAWQWLKQGVKAAEALAAGATGDESIFYRSKIHTLKYFFEYELIKTRTWHKRLQARDFMTVDMENELLV